MSDVYIMAFFSHVPVPGHDHKKIYAAMSQASLGRRCPPFSPRGELSFQVFLQRS